MSDAGHSAPGPRVTVAIPNWNGMPHLPECLEALSGQTYRDFEVVVVDNASTDKSVSWLERVHPEVRVIMRADNGGFSAAVNEGIRACRGEYVVLLNNDTAADAAWLSELVGALDARPDYAMAASLMLLYDQPDVVNAAGDVYGLCAMAAHNRGLGEPADRYATQVRVFGACAGAAAYRRSLFDEIGLFDEDFFLMSEDTDVNLRALIAGAKCLYVPSARARHKLRATIDAEPSERMETLMWRNEALVFAKDMPWPVLAALPCVWGWRLLRSTLPLRPAKWARIPRLLKALPRRIAAEREGFRMGFGKRRDVWSRRRAGTLAVIRWVLSGTGKA